VKKTDVEIGSDISKAGSRLGRSPQHAKTGLAGDPDGRREDASAEVPSTSLRISPAGSDARKTAQHRSFDFAQDFACGFPLG